MKIRKWRLEHHPTTDPIPMAVVLALWSTDVNDYIPLLEKREFYGRAKTLVDEHNALVDKVEDLELKIEHLLYEMP